MRDLKRLHTGFCRAASVRMSGELRSFVELEVIDLDQGPWQELYGHVPQPAVYGVVQAESVGKPLVIAAEAGEMSLLLDVMLGGSAGGLASRTKFTDIDMSLIRKVVVGLCTDLGDQWQRVSDETLVLRSLETEQFAANVVPPSEPSVSITIMLRLGAMSATLSVLCPYGSIKHLLGDLAHGSYRLGADRRVEPASPADGLAGTEVEVRAEVLEQYLTCGELTQLEVGQQLLLPAGWEESVALRTGDEAVYRTRPGRFGNQRAIEVIEAWVSDDEEPHPIS